MEPGVVDQLYAIPMIDVVKGEQLFGMPDTFGDDGREINGLQIITAVKTRIIAASGIQERPVQIIRQEIRMEITDRIKPEYAPPWP